MGKTSKASKKFVRKHLGAAIKQRKTRQKTKRAKQQQEEHQGEFSACRAQFWACCPF
jgi:hypothetical protein